MGEKTPDTGFAPSGQGCAELNPFLDGFKVVSVFALFGALSLEDVRDEGRVADYRAFREVVGLIAEVRKSLSYLPSWLPMYSINDCCAASIPAASNSSGENLASA